MPEGRRLGILISGRGSNFEAIAGHIDAGRLDASISVVISNRPDAAGLAIARKRGIPSLIMPSKGIAREEYDARLAAELRARNVDLVCLAGFMRLLSPVLIREFPMRILNIHPSSCPPFRVWTRRSRRSATAFRSPAVQFISWMNNSTPVRFCARPLYRFSPTTPSRPSQPVFSKKNTSSTQRRLDSFSQVSTASKGVA